MNLYADDTLVARLTDWHIQGGRTVFQVFQFPGGERIHSLCVLEHLGLRHGARVLSLGCGVGGMERYMHDARPDLEFELVNISPAQLARCLCPGRKVCADAQDYRSDAGPFGCVLLAYVLGHLDALPALRCAFDNCAPGGRVLVLDVFDAAPEFVHALEYRAARADDLRGLGFRELVPASTFELVPLFRHTMPDAARLATPGIYGYDA